MILLTELIEPAQSIEAFKNNTYKAINDLYDISYQYLNRLQKYSVINKYNINKKFKIKPI